jgi:hypothetical protein
MIFDSHTVLAATPPNAARGNPTNPPKRPAVTAVNEAPAIPPAAVAAIVSTLFDICSLSSSEKSSFRLSSISTTCTNTTFFYLSEFHNQ